MKPTAEQEAVVEAALANRTLAVEALAGTGKTSSLVLLARAMRGRGLYVAFNRAIVADAKPRFPKNVDCRTAHSLAFREVGKLYTKRMDSPRMRSDEVARLLGCDRVEHRICDLRIDGPKLAGVAMRTARRFEKSPDVGLLRSHVPRPPGFDDRGHAQLAELALPLAVRFWEDLLRPDGRLPFVHDTYLKIWQLSGPVIDADFILFDEAQDADPVMLDVVQSQSGARQIFVGDRHQAIYEWRGAVNAMRAIRVEQRRWLTMSFRFGPAIAERANEYLARIDAAKLVRGHPDVASTVGPVPEPDAILTRTNATAVATAIEALERGRRPALLGGGGEVKQFAIAARRLQARQPVTHPDLACFDDWGQVQHFVAHDDQGSDIAMLVRLVDAWGPDTIIGVVDRCVDERAADLLVSTAHKAKGREWPKVRIAADFPTSREEEVADGDAAATRKPPSPEEIRLAYVAVTRAKLRLDVTEPGSSPPRPAPRPPASPRPGASPDVARRRPLTGSRVPIGEIKVGIGRPKPRG